jgi:hypothetical protein
MLRAKLAYGSRPLSQPSCALLIPELCRHKALGVNCVPQAQNGQSGADRRAKVRRCKVCPRIAGLGRHHSFEFWRQTSPDCGPLTQLYASNASRFSRPSAEALERSVDAKPYFGTSLICCLSLRI